MLLLEQFSGSWHAVNDHAQYQFKCLDCHGAVQIDTEGPVAQDDFIVTYHGEPLNKSMVLLVNNTLQYTLQLAQVEREESY